MTTQKGVWIDHQKAIIVVPGQDAATTVEADVPRHTRFSGGSGHPAGASSQRGGSEKRREARYDNALDRYFDAVAAQLGDVESLLILGPGEAKAQLAARLERVTARPKPVVAVQTTDKLTDAQVRARVAEYFESP